MTKKIRWGGSGRSPRGTRKGRGGKRISTAHDGLMFSEGSSETGEILTEVGREWNLWWQIIFLALGEVNAITIGCYRTCKRPLLQPWRIWISELPLECWVWLMVRSHGEWENVGGKSSARTIFFYLLQTPHPVLAVSSATGAHKSHALHYGCLSRGETVKSSTWWVSMCVLRWVGGVPS